MSTLKVTNIQATGETASRPVSGVAAAWVNFNGFAATILDSYNIASLTDQGTGQYQFAFTNNMGNVNFASTSSTGNNDSSNAGVDRNSQMGTGSSSNFHYELCAINTTSNEDAVRGYAVIHGDLA